MRRRRLLRMTRCEEHLCPSLLRRLQIFTDTPLRDRFSIKIAPTMNLFRPHCLLILLFV